MAVGAPRAVRGAARSVRTYDAFVSYSHAADGRLAPAMQAGLQRFAKPWYRLRSLRVFRDDASLSADPALWVAIEGALASSEWFLLLASPEAARSEWVEKEVAWWLERRGSERLLVILTAGELAWDADGEGVDKERTTALPASALASLVLEPRWVDLRWARTAEDVSLANACFRDSVAEVAATVLGQPKDELLGEDVRQQARRTTVDATDGCASSAPRREGHGCPAAAALSRGRPASGSTAPGWSRARRSPRSTPSSSA
jgi:MTH538 TIR-like domain (DUF1863)